MNIRCANDLTVIELQERPAGRRSIKSNIVSCDFRLANELISHKFFIGIDFLNIVELRIKTEMFAIIKALIKFRVLLEITFKIVKSCTQSIRCINDV